MEISLYLQSAYEEYDKMHMCRRHWNYQWGGRKGKMPFLRIPSIKMREECFGGLIQNIDGKIYKIDKQGFEVVRHLKKKKPLEEISSEMNISKDGLLSFVNYLQSLGINPNE